MNAKVAAYRPDSSSQVSLSIKADQPFQLVKAAPPKQGAPSRTVRVDGQLFYDYGPSNMISAKGQQAIRVIFGTDPSGGQKAAYTYGNGYHDPVVKNESGFSGGTYKSPKTGALGAYVFPDRARQEGLALGYKDGVDAVATQEVAQRFLALKKPRPDVELVGDAVTVFHSPQYAFKLVQLTATANYSKIHPDYAQTADASQQALGVLANNYNRGTGNYVSDGKALLDDVSRFIQSKNGQIGASDLNEENFRSYATSVLKVDPNVFIAKLQASYRATYKELSRRVIQGE